MFKKWNEIKKELFPKIEIIIDFNGIVSTPKKIINVLISYCDKENKDLVILKEDILPIVKIDGKTYIVRSDCLVGMIWIVRKLNSSYPPPYFACASINKKLYLYSYYYIQQ